MKSKAKRREFPFPDVRPQLEPIFKPIMERATGRYLGVNKSEFTPCEKCDDPLCVHFLKSIGEYVELKARKLASTEEFKTDCQILFAEMMMNELKGEERASIYRALQKSQHVQSKAPVEESSEFSEDGDGAESDEVNTPPRKVKKPKKNKSTASTRTMAKQLEKASAPRRLAIPTITMGDDDDDVVVVNFGDDDEEEADDQEVRAEIEKEQFKKPLPRSSSSKGKTVVSKDKGEKATSKKAATKSKKRERSKSKPSKTVPRNDNVQEENEDDQGEEEQDDDTAMETITTDDYHQRQTAKAIDILVQMRTECPGIETIVKERKDPRFPSMQTPTAHMATIEHFVKVSSDGTLITLLNESDPFPKGAEGYLRTINKLNKWFALVRKCFLFVGLFLKMKEDDVDNAVTYRAVAAGLRKKGAVGIPKYTTAKLLEQLGNFILRYPRLIYQTRLTSMKIWTQFILDKRLSTAKISERRLISFFDAIFNKNKEVASYWSEKIPITVMGDSESTLR